MLWPIVIAQISSGGEATHLIKCNCNCNCNWLLVQVIVILLFLV